LAAIWLCAATVVDVDAGGLELTTAAGAEDGAAEEAADEIADVASAAGAEETAGAEDAWDSPLATTVTPEPAALAVPTSNPPVVRLAELIGAGGVVGAAASTPGAGAPPADIVTGALTIVCIVLLLSCAFAG